MLGKYDRHQALQQEDDFDEWIDGYHKGLVEIAEYMSIGSTILQLQC